MKILHLSDLHLVDPDRSPTSADAARAIAAGLKCVLGTHSDSDLCVISGDIAEDGEPAVYEFLKAHLGQSTMQQVLMLGNHDNRDVFLDVFGSNGVDANGFVQSKIDAGGYLFLSLDTVEEGSDAGGLCEKRLDWLAACLDNAGDRPVILAMHHPPFDVGDPIMDPIKLQNPGDLARVLDQASTVQHILFGHIHRASTYSWNGIICTSVPAFKPNAATPSEMSGPMVGVLEFSDGQIAKRVDVIPQTLGRDPQEGD